VSSPRVYEKLRDYQKTAVDFAISRDGAGLFLDPRTGKTWIGLSIIQESNAYDVLIVGPKTNKITTWHKLITELLPDYVVCFDFDTYKDAKGSRRILLVHYEELPKVIKRAARIEWDLVIADESQRLKARNSGQSRNLRKLRHAKRRIALSGTPMDKQEIDLWAQMRFFAPDEFGVDWRPFDEYFLKPTGYMGYQRKFREDRLEEFYSRIKPHCLRITRDVAGIKEPELIWVPVQILGEQRRVYDQMEQELIVELTKATVVAKLEVTKLVKLQQITSGFIRDEEGVDHYLWKAKERALRRLIKNNLTPPAIIFCQYTCETEVVARVCREFSDSVVILRGDVKEKDRIAMIKDFQLGKIDYMVCQQRTGGVGVDMYYARNAIFYSHTHSFIDFDQAKSRMDIPHAEPPKIFLIYVCSSIDTDKKDAISLKRSLTKVTLDRLKLRRK
jgi:SNF2 family DNA or RNA helicase